MGATGGSVKGASRGVNGQGSRGSGNKAPKPVVLRDPAFAVKMLEEAIESTYRRMRKETDQDAFVKLANSLAMATTRLVNAHRILALLASGHASVEEALKELQNLAFEVD